MRKKGGIPPVSIDSQHPHDESKPRLTRWIRCDAVASALVAALETDNVRSRTGFIGSYPPPIQWPEVEQVMKQVFP